VTSPWEMAAVLFGIVAVYLTVRENVWCWPTGLVNVGLSILVFWQARLYADMGQYLMYVGLCLYGWYKWLHGGPDQSALLVTRTPRPALPALAALGLVGGSLLGLAFARFTDASLPFWDSATTAFSLVAQYMQTRKWLENWMVWIAVDLAYLGIYAYKALYLMTGLTALYLVLAVLGHLRWNRTLQAGPRAGAAAPAV